MGDLSAGRRRARMVQDTSRRQTRLSDRDQRGIAQGGGGGNARGGVSFVDLANWRRNCRERRLSACGAVRVTIFVRGRERRLSGRACPSELKRSQPTSRPQRVGHA
jgi:hypothetical protein